MRGNHRSPCYWVPSACNIAVALLFIAQPALVAAGATRVHRGLGWLGLALAIAMLGLGGSAILFGLWSGQLPPFYPHGLFLVRGMIALVTFFVLIVAGFAFRRQPQWHKRLLLCATIVVTLPALERSLPLPAWGAAWPFFVDGIADSILLIGPIVDLIERRRVHPAYFYGVGIPLAGQLLTDLIAPSPATTCSQLSTITSQRSSESVRAIRADRSSPV